MTAQLTANNAVSFSKCKLLYTSEVQQPQVEFLQALVSKHQLSLSLNTELISGKLNQKYREQLSAEATQPILLLDDKNKLSWLSNGLSVAPEWDKLQRRVVSAGRKSELLLQATKISADSYVIDATAGFGHDSLILASTGAQVIMLEQQPLIALLLLAERERMSTQPNWQKLMSRLHIINIDALSYFAHRQDTTTLKTTDAVNNFDKKSIDVVYLDPMFPEDSYQDSKTGKGAKVGKHMQALHYLACPPTLAQEQQLLKSAQMLVSSNVIDNIKQQGRVIVKRPQHAPLFAHQTPNDSWQNEAVRFDGYFV
ncbi:class I SAM-dependent methyltransferase [Psychrobacter sp. LV10R520-6]|uniref:class I SAM-dependent methyltransferase n=1 Tax=Psychrobacter sp. LV10R520-6 TaxID=1415574 RepID=UPI0024C5D8F0|nr:class I SAM-dependent methyltransferase [Psychrobacter sp. LV10R520-6]SNT70516.1 16S rRNA (guanine1516-N2)-methyltransferase [Psychrobacter sp. LV10R520-6]